MYPEFTNASIDFELTDYLVLRFVNKTGIFDYDFQKGSIKYASEFVQTLNRTPDAFELKGTQKFVATPEESIFINSTKNY
jgi:hypothetical protein